MNDDRIVRLLEELRDLQRQHLANYGEAVRNQEESIRLQKDAMGRVRFLITGVTVATGLLLLALLVILSRLVGRLG